jgi:hypothetical protein
VSGVRDQKCSFLLGEPLISIGGLAFIRTKCGTCEERGGFSKRIQIELRHAVEQSFTTNTLS